MFNWTLFVSLVLVCVPGLLVAIPNLLQSLGETLADKMPPGRTLPSHAVLVAATLAQSLLLVVVASAVGTALAPRVGLAAPFFTALVSGQSLWDAAAPQLLPALLLGVGGALVIVVAYYLYFRPRLDAPTVRYYGRPADGTRRRGAPALRRHRRRSAVSLGRADAAGLDRRGLVRRRHAGRDVGRYRRLRRALWPGTSA